jgi:hydroxyacylglutathione hydrolase
MFEGTPQQFWHSLERLRALPDDMRVYCAHEYTQSNARFAVTDRDRQPAADGAPRFGRRRARRGEATVPSLLGEEKQTNPSCAPTSRRVQKAVGMLGADR